MNNIYKVGLVELVSPNVLFSSTTEGEVSEKHQPLIRRASEALLLKGKRSKSHVKRQDSRVMLVNNKLVELAIKACTEKLYITYTEPLPDSFMRTVVPEVYNTLWDMCIHWGKMHLECVVLHPGIQQMKDKWDILKENEVELVMNVGKRLDKHVISKGESPSFKGDVVSVEAQLKTIIEGSPFILYDNPSDKLPKVPVVALGGTFDNLHNGHRNLLSVALVICTKKLYIGIASDSMLKQKKNADLIESIQARYDRARKFLDTMVRPNGIEVELVTLTDPYGPTVEVANIDAIVVSSETLGGARQINEIRKSKKLKQLSIVAVLRSNIHTLSSTFIRDNKV